MTATIINVGHSAVSHTIPRSFFYFFCARLRSILQITARRIDIRYMQYGMTAETHTQLVMTCEPSKWGSKSATKRTRASKNRRRKKYVFINNNNEHHKHKLIMNKYITRSVRIFSVLFDRSCCVLTFSYSYFRNNSSERYNSSLIKLV